MQHSHSHRLSASNSGRGLLLNRYSGAAAAYSLRRVGTGSGDAIRVRRSSDNAEQDFSPQEITDGTLETFCGVGNGFVVTWHDQSGNGRHATQPTASSQPQIVSSGSLVVDGNGLPTVRFDGSTDVMVVPTFMSGAGTAVYVCKADTDPPVGGDGAPVAAFGSAADTDHLPFSDGVIYHGWGSTVRKTVGNPTPSLASPRIISQLSDTNDWRFWIDGSLFFSTGTNTVGWGANPRLGNTGATFYQGDISEVIIYNSALSDTVREAVQQNLSDHYTIALA